MNYQFSSLTEELLEEQAKFQAKYFPIDQIDERDVVIAINQELAELIESLPFYKWWTKKPLDKQNAKIEAVDMYHFMLIYLLIQRDIYKHDVITYTIALDHGLHSAKQVPIYEVLRNLVDTLEYPLRTEFFENFGMLIGNLFNDLNEFKDLYLKKLQLNEERQKKNYKENYEAKYIEPGIEDNTLLY